MSMENDLSYAYENNLPVRVIKKDGSKVKGKIKSLNSDHLAIDAGLSVTVVFYRSIVSFDIIDMVGW
jgi:hypothetical protein